MVITWKFIVGGRQRTAVARLATVDWNDRFESRTLASRTDVYSQLGYSRTGRLGHKTSFFLTLLDYVSEPPCRLKWDV